MARIEINDLKPGKRKLEKGEMKSIFGGFSWEVEYDKKTTGSSLLSQGIDGIEGESLRWRM